MTLADYETTVHHLFVAYMGRPAFDAELSHFTQALLAQNAPVTLRDLEGAMGTNFSIRDMIHSFGNSTESTSLHEGNNLQFVASFYASLFNRTPDMEGLMFWIGVLDRNELTRPEAALAIMNGASANPSAQSALDVLAMEHKVEVGTIISRFVTSQVELVSYDASNLPANSRAALGQVDSATPLQDYVKLAARAVLPSQRDGIIPSTPIYTLSSDAPSVAEGHSGTTALVFHVTLDRAPSSSYNVPYATVNGTAGISDFQSTVGLLTFGAGQTAATVTINVNGDLSAEANETMHLVFGDIYLVQGVAAAGTISNDDGAIAASLVGVSDFQHNHWLA